MLIYVLFLGMKNPIIYYHSILAYSKTKQK